MGAERKETSNERYDRTHTAFIGLKLNKSTCSALEGKPKQTEIKRLVRKGLELELNSNGNS